MPRDETSQPARPASSGRRFVWSMSAGAGERLRHWIASPSTSRPAASPCCSAHPAAARPPACASSPAWRRRARAGRDCRPRCDQTCRRRARGVAMVFQSYALFPHLTVAENIVFGLKARRVPPPERARRLERAVEILGIGHLLQRKPCAALRRPAAARRSRPRHRRRGAGLPDGRTAVEPRCAVPRRYATRNSGAATAARHHHAVRHPRSDRGDGHGRSDRSAARRPYRTGRATRGIYARPATSFAASFIGTPPMNLFPLERRGE